MSLMERLERLNLVDGQLRGLSVRVEKAKTFHRAQTKQLDLGRQRTEEAKANLLQVKAAYGVVETEAKALDTQIETSRERMDTSATAKEYNALLVELNTVKNERAKLDETMVQQLDEVERLEALVTESESSASERESVVAAAAQEVQEREAEIAERVSELKPNEMKPLLIFRMKSLICTTHCVSSTTVKQPHTLKSRVFGTKSFLAVLAACRFHLPLCQNCTPALDKFSSAPTAPASCFSEKMFEMSWTKTPKRMSSVVRKQRESVSITSGRAPSARTNLIHQPAAIDSLRPGQHPSSH